jgi:hypothetical protein
MVRKSKEERRSRLKDKMKSNGSSGGHSIYALDFSVLGKDVESVKPKEGVNEFDIVPYIIQDGKKHPDGEEGVGYEDWCLIFAIHYNVGSKNGNVVCLKTYGKNTPCPICEERERLKESGVDDKTYNALKPSWRVAYNVKTSEGVRPFFGSFSYFHKEMMEELNVASPEDGIFVPADLDEGRTVTFRATKEFQKHMKFFKFKSFKFEKRDPINEDILDESVALEKLLNVLSYEQIEKMFFGNDTIVEEEPEVEKEVKEEIKEEVKEEPKEEVSERRIRPRKEKKKEEPKCPIGLVFGKDNNIDAKCDDCPDDVYGECYDLHDEKYAN